MRATGLYGRGLSRRKKARGDRGHEGGAKPAAVCTGHGGAGRAGKGDKKQVSWLESAQKELDEKKKEALDKLAQAEAALEEKAGQVSIPEIAWSITDRADTVSFSSYKSNSEKVAAIAKVFPVFFFMVAALVALTTMTRMVEEERTQTGTLKALGYSESAIAFYYVSYAVLAGLTGGIVGVTVGFTPCPRL